MTIGKIVGALVIVTALLAPSASAQVLDMWQSPVEVAALDVPDGTWDQDEDWGYNGGTTWMLERWIGGAGSFVEIDQGINVADPFGPFTTPIDIMKDVENATDFFWTDFHVDLIPQTGADINNVTASPTAQFGNVMVMENPDESWSIWWDNFTGGTGVAIGETADIDFSFEIEGDISFRIRQVPTPEPSSLALLGIGAAILLRRKSRG